MQVNIRVSQNVVFVVQTGGGILFKYLWKDRAMFDALG
jgi:hypothetical protein